MYQEAAFVNQFFPVVKSGLFVCFSLKDICLFYFFINFIRLFFIFYVFEYRHPHTFV